KAEDSNSRLISSLDLRFISMDGILFDFPSSKSGKHELAASIITTARSAFYSREISATKTAKNAGIFQELICRQ
ncbi:MAG: hypothetical protein Q9P14_09125, partial [candidate division KSB1 bacterium]|nr:hypothetical protein [candidate division KSB1 bacterium]